MAAVATGIYQSNSTSMLEPIKKIFRKTPLYPLWCLRRERIEIAQWEAAGRPLPPPAALKQRNLRRIAKEHRLRVLVETGTFAGQTVEALRRNFARIFSIELSREYHEAAKRRFAAHPHIELIQGDSGEMLKKIVARLDQPALFWLDGHYSGGATARGSVDTPIIEELSCLYPDSRGHVVVIDDARLFGQDPAYPTIERIREFVRSKGCRGRVDIVDDAIVIVPVLTTRS